MAHEEFDQELVEVFKKREQHITTLCGSLSAMISAITFTVLVACICAIVIMIFWTVRWVTG